MDLLQGAQIESIKAQGEAQVRLIQSASGDSKKKAIAISNAIVNMHISIIKVLESK